LIAKRQNKWREKKLEIQIQIKESTSQNPGDLHANKHISISFNWKRQPAHHLSRSSGSSREKILSLQLDLIEFN
jgi:hypothetical protein